MSNTISSGNDLSYLFGGASSSKPATLYDSLGDYASLKNGSASKLYKAYYAKEKESTKEAKNSISTTEKNAYNTVKSSAEELSAAVDKLSSSSIYQKGEFQKTAKDGTKSDAEYDYDKIYSAVKDFADSYNALIKNGSSENLSSLNDVTVRMLKNTRTNSGLLGQVGISVAKDGTLSIDRDKFNEANISSIKALFSGQGSFADSTASRAGVMKNSAANKLSNSKVYNAEGTSEKNSDDNSTYNAIV
ncbi:MAG: flagellar filament capping protein FliD [Lachnospiraceae bacterium]|nr:flagellar filament capping protein FliD [Lachnospiraceae bacterium]